MVKDEMEIVIKLSRRGLASGIVDEFKSRSQEKNNKSSVINRAFQTKVSNYMYWNATFYIRKEWHSWGCS